VLILNVFKGWDHAMLHTYTTAKLYYDIWACMNWSLRTDTLELGPIKQETNSKQGACRIFRRSGQLWGRGCNWHCAGLYLSQNCVLRSSPQLWKYNENILQTFEVEMHNAGCLITCQAIKVYCGLHNHLPNIKVYSGMHNHLPSYKSILWAA
jgi:hypothetical protein